MAQFPGLDRGWSQACGDAGFPLALRCLIRPWRALEPWITHEDEDSRASHHGSVRLVDILTQRREAVILTGKFGDWSPITVHLDGAISVRKREAAFKGQMFAAYPGDLVFSKIDVRNGAIGLVPQAIAKAVITPEFPVLMPHPDKIDGRYLELILQAGGFVAALRRKASGTSGRKRITPAIFLDLAIPLPPLAAQQTLVAAHRAALARAAADEAKAEALELQAVADFADALGLAPSAPLPDNPVFIAKFRDLDRWSHEAVLRRSIGGEAHEAAWPTVRLGDVISDLQNGWSPKCYDRPAEGDEWGVLKLGAVSFGVFDERQNKGLPKGFAPRPSLEVKPGQVLISRANITRLVGATALVGEVRPRLLLCDKIFRCVFLEDSVIDPAFVAEVLRIGSVREQIEAGVTGTSPTMKNISKPALLALAFPLPPLDVQRSLVAALVQARTSATTLRIAASISRSEARVAFEAAVYS